VRRVLTTAEPPGPENRLDVLIVDDQAPFRAVARTLVGLVPDWRVRGEAESGEEAIDYALSHRPAVILMDVDLPGVSGIEATRRILAELPETRIVLVSTFSAADLPAAARSCGALAYICKDELTAARLRGLPQTAPPGGL
jgi:DNA-binding NarL/FixJ family response regulator